jgi:monofunctional biosynthetic peptidoglycan transglycosylase
MAAMIFLFTVGKAQAGSVAEFTSYEIKSLGWGIVDDGVMGGLSQGRYEITKEGILRFFGTLSLENNGGFSSLRSQNVQMDWSGVEGLILRVKGDGRNYQIRLSTDAEYRGGEVSFQAEFATKKGEWIEIKIPFKNLLGSWRGVKLPDKTFDAAKVRRIGLLLGDKQQGPFELQVDWIRTYSSRTDGAP